MRAINIPAYNNIDVYQICINSISNASLKGRFNKAIDDIKLAVNEYSTKAPLAKLFQIKPLLGKDDSIVTGSTTKEDFKKLYSTHMVGQKKPAREIYDALKLGAPLNICPFCGFGHVGTLDHYLPKSRYPYLTVLPINLVPSCYDCNKGKGSGLPETPEQQCLHPYFDHGLITTEQWLFAKVIETSPATIQYFVRPPKDWEQIDKERVETHFFDFDLSSRFSTQATTELTILKELLLYDYNINGMDGVQSELKKRATVAFGLHKNAWNTALFQALAKSDWYCDGGFFEE
jgi:hypothetical protein